MGAVKNVLKYNTGIKHGIFKVAEFKFYIILTLVLLTVASEKGKEEDPKTEDRNTFSVFAATEILFNVGFTQHGNCGGRIHDQKCHIIQYRY